MPTYKNISGVSKTFYGVEIKPGEIKTINGIINCPGIIRCAKPVVVPEKKKPIQQKTTKQPIQKRQYNKRKSNNQYPKMELSTLVKKPENK